MSLKSTDEMTNSVEPDLSQSVEHLENVVILL